MRSELDYLFYVLRQYSNFLDLDLPRLKIEIIPGQQLPVADITVRQRWRLLPVFADFSTTPINENA
tara:strand:- start:393 stop:590 length:198 start_codon:yes stop_codon:yes gene_type:complete